MANITDLGSVPLGQRVTLTFHFYALDGVTLVDPAAPSARTVSGASSTLASYVYPATMAKTSTGIYTIQVLCNETGQWEGSAFDSTSGAEAYHYYTWDVQGAPNSALYP